MTSWYEGEPFAVTVSVLFVIVLLRAQATYWLARGVRAGLLKTSLADRVTGARTERATIALHRWGPPVVTLSFLTIGLQTVVNAAAGLIRMPWIRYSVAMVIGCAAWAVIYATIGIAAVEASLALAARSPWALVGVLVLAAVAVGAVMVLRRRRSREVDTAPAADSGPL